MADRYWVGGAGTWDTTSTTNWSSTSGGAAGASAPTSADAVLFDANSGTGTVTVSSGVTCLSVVLNKSGLTVQMTADMTVVNNFNLTAGALDLNGKTLTAQSFISSNANVRSIAFGAVTGLIVVTGNNAAIFNIDTPTNLTVSGTPVVRATYSGATGARTFSGGAGIGEARAFNLEITAGTDSIAFSSASSRAFKNVNFTGFSGTYLSDTSAVAFFGDLTLSSTMTIQDGSGLMVFSSSGTQTITTNGITFRRPIFKNGTGTLVFSGDFTSGTGRGIEVTTGTLNSNNVAVSTTTFVASGTNAKTLQFGSSTWTITGSGTAWEANVASLTVVPGTGTVSMTSTSAKTFSGGGKTYGTLNQGGTGALTVSGSNTFASMTNTVQPATISLTAGTTTTVTTFTVSGTAGNLITLNSTSAGNRATLTDSGGVNSVSYMDIKDIAATGYGEWQAYTSNGNVDSGNNVGWVFAEPPPLTASEYQISLKSFTERRSF